jgi:DNA methylase
MAKGKARTFNQDPMRGEHTFGPNHGRSKVAPGGSKLPATKVGPDGKFARADLHAKYRPEDGWRPTGLTFASGTPRRDEVSLKLQDTSSGTSIFDPVLCELAYRWFCPPGGLVLDPFAGGSVRGLIASKLGRRYVGIELRPEQIAANARQADRICDDPRPQWIEGDAIKLAALVGKLDADFVFSCPPYGGLEVYSDDPRDLSTMPHEQFIAAYRQIIAEAVGHLRPDRFACFVVGDFRDRKGFYRRFVSDTEQAFADAGAGLYNEAILVTAVGSLPIRTGRMFETARKLGKTHQNVLVFCKGDPKVATDAIGAVEFGDPVTVDPEPIA